MIQKGVIPELHNLQGYVNHRFGKDLVPLVGREKTLLWATNLKDLVQNYEGEIFGGNARRTLAKHADQLLDLEIYEKVGLVPPVSAFKAMDKFVSSSFSTKTVGHDLDKQLLELAKALKSTRVSGTENSRGFEKYETMSSLFKQYWIGFVVRTIR